MAMMITY